MILRSITTVLFSLATIAVMAQKTDSLAIDTSLQTTLLQDVVILSTRAGQNQPAAYTEVSDEELQKQNLGQDLPYLLDLQPSMVTTSDAGAGVGYTALRIRGSDQSRINVTINGIPYNDAESQGAYWVDLPDLASSVSSIQIQRGLGTSTNGAGAFGGTINIKTVDPPKDAYGIVSGSYGSFNTWRANAMFGTGLIKNKFAFEGRISKISSDGYIDRASTDLLSYFLGGGYYGKRDVIRFYTFGGLENTYQAWNGIDETTLQTDRTFNSAGTDYGAKTGKPYDNEVDHYRQDHYQLIYSRQLSPYLYENSALHYTRGYGYYEQYKVGQSFADYNLDNVVVGSDTITSTDLIRRRWLDNYFYGATYALVLEHSNYGITAGGGWNQYIGKHYGEIIWSQYASNSNYESRYYENAGIKNDANIYLKVNWRPVDKLNLFVDLQYRNVVHVLGGRDNDQRFISLAKNLNFFNPKLGLSANLGNKNQLYGVFGMGHREPTRSDFIDAPTDMEPKPEQLLDAELGYWFRTAKYQFNINYYMMYYKDQLVLTGELNDVGSPIRSNVDKSYRTGLELMASLKPIKLLLIQANLTYSINRINSFKEVLYVYDDNYNYLETQVNEYKNTPISYSPDLVSGLSVTILPVKGLELELQNKFVGKQYLDNTGSSIRQLDAYNVANFRASYSFGFKKGLENITLSLLVNNLFNMQYESNGYTFGEVYRVSGVDTRADYNYYYPQAGINVLSSISLKF